MLLMLYTLGILLTFQSTLFYRGTTLRNTKFERTCSVKFVNFLTVRTIYKIIK